MFKKNENLPLKYGRNGISLWPAGRIHPLANSCAPDSTWNNSSDENYAQIPLQPVAHCVATLLMIVMNSTQ
ncbi:hypothetical protein WN944_025520 [Citrus x changshan-huyou]|uniref:Uncharacterized protein n=1 Tax=Citrus x changshan-huyou TaxID=2935761 RepID=A0AAP0QCC2_9ROSI